MLIYRQWLFEKRNEAAQREIEESSAFSRYRMYTFILIMFLVYDPPLIRRKHLQIKDESLRPEFYNAARLVSTAKSNIDTTPPPRYYETKYHHIKARELANNVAEEEHQRVLDNMRRRMAEYTKSKELYKNPVYSYLLNPSVKKVVTGNRESKFVPMGNFEKRRRELLSDMNSNTNRNYYPTSARRSSYSSNLYNYSGGGSRNRNRNNRPYSAPPKKAVSTYEDISIEPRPLQEDELEDMLKEELLSIIVRRNLYKASDLRELFDHALRRCRKPGSVFTVGCVERVISDLKQRFNLYY